MAQRRDRRPLIAYLRVQKSWERETLTLLQRSASDIERELRKLAPNGRPGVTMRRSQLQSARLAMLEQQADIWRAVGASVRTARLEAAATAAAAEITGAKAVLQRVPDMTPQRMRLLEASMKETSRRGLVTALQRVQGASYRPLAESVYGSQRLATKQVDRLINSALTRGLSARELATEAKALIRPDVRGGVSYAAQRLGRTELNNAFHATQVRTAIEAPWVTGVKWNLSASHPEEDECDDYDGQVFDPREVPEKPHPQCFCFMTNELIPVSEAAKSTQFNSYIDRVMRDAGYSESTIAAGKE